jgi:RNA polymerase sigma factor (sigma-70 family)
MDSRTVDPTMVDENLDLTQTILRERPRLLNFIRRRVRDQMEAEDILQDVLSSFVEAFRLPSVIEHASGWLFRVARNRIIDRFRNKAVASGSDSVQDREMRALYLDIELPSLEGDPEADFTRLEILAALEQALDELPATQRDVFIAHEIEGLSFEGLSRRGGIPLNTLLSRKRYAVLHLRRRLQAFYDELNL